VWIRLKELICSYLDTVNKKIFLNWSRYLIATERAPAIHQYGSQWITQNIKRNVQICSVTIIPKSMYKIPELYNISKSQLIIIAFGKHPPPTHTRPHPPSHTRSSFYTAHTLTQQYVLMISRTYTISYTYKNPLERPLLSNLSSIPRYVITLKSIPSLWPGLMCEFPSTVMLHLSCKRFLIAFAGVCCSTHLHASTAFNRPGVAVQMKMR
jgi:hypothetical protein